MRFPANKDIFECKHEATSGISGLLCLLLRFGLGAGGRMTLMMVRTLKDVLAWVLAKEIPLALALALTINLFGQGLFQLSRKFLRSHT